MTKYHTTGKLYGRCPVVLPIVPEWTEEQEAACRDEEMELISDFEDSSDEEEEEEEEEEKEEPGEQGETKEEGGEESSDSEDEDEDEDEAFENAEVLRCVFKLCHTYMFRQLVGVEDTHCFLAWHGNQSVVVKVSPVFADESFVPKEARLLMALRDHPHVQQLIAWYNFDEFYAVVSPEYPYTSIRHIWDDPRLVQSYIRQLLTTIRDLHTLGIVHRDIKTSNIMWDRQRQHMTLIDFDIATFYKGEPVHQRKVGTSFYMAPELWNEQPYGTAVDLFSAGVVLGELVYKQRESEVERKTVTKWIRQLRRQMRNKRKKGMKPIRHLLRQLLQGDPTHRPTAEEALKHPYFQQTFPPCSKET